MSIPISDGQSRQCKIAGGLSDEPGLSSAGAIVTCLGGHLLGFRIVPTVRISEGSRNLSNKLEAVGNTPADLIALFGIAQTRKIGMGQTVGSEFEGS
jgi:hypothetical protein